jgi:gluconolactonase
MRIEARVWTTLPDALHLRGAPSRWAAMTRPGKALHSFLEAPVPDGAGGWFLCDVAGGRVLRVTEAGAWTVEHDLGSPAHAMRILPDGRRIGADYDRGLVEITGPREARLLWDAGAEARFLGLSDMALAPDGCLWITDSGRSSLSDPSGSVWRWDGASAPRRVLAGLPYPNGVALSPDGAFAYVAMTRGNALWRLGTALPAAGAPMAGVFLHLGGGLGPDGLAVNPWGWIAVAQAQAGRAYVFDALGDPVADVRVTGGLWTTSVAFDPADPARLLIVEAQAGALHVAHLPREGRT